jgi:hypothetical protein
MAKAQFTIKQKVWVESVGAWATVEKITPVWAKGFDEPVKITYDVGFGRDFTAAELRAEDAGGDDGADLAHWRLLRAKNKWQQPEECAHHPFPGTYPIIVTDANDWGGWRTPGAEYDRDPQKIEKQARLIAETPKLLAIAQDLLDLVSETPEDAPEEIQAIAQRCAAVLRAVAEVPAQAKAEVVPLKAVS